MSNPYRILKQELEALQRAGVTHVPRELAELASLMVEAGRAEASRAGERSPTSSSTPRPNAPVAAPGARSTAAAIAPVRPAASASPAQPAASQPVPDRPAANQPSQPAIVASSTAPAVPVSRPLYENAAIPKEFDPAMTEITRPCSRLSRDERDSKLTSLKKQVAACRRCQELAETRTQTVFGVGNPEARVMFVGEAPGADEDKTGEPFVGRAGQLLNKIIEASKMTREEIYICNILRCRPPGNRAPVPEEAANCREFLDGQIEIVDPEYIICWGSTAAHNLLDTKAPIGKMRGKFFDYKGIKVLCTYHPSYLLRQPSAKAQVWEDIKLFRADMGVTLQ
jgi:uracil-DNA glycosylase